MVPVLSVIGLGWGDQRLEWKIRVVQKAASVIDDLLKIFRQGGSSGQL